MSEITSETVAARLTLRTGDVLSVTVGGVWSCPEPALADLYNAAYGRDQWAYSVGHGAALAELAREDRGGTVEVLVEPDAGREPLPPGAVY